MAEIFQDGKAGSLQGSIFRGRARDATTQINAAALPFDDFKVLISSEEPMETDLVSDNEAIEESSFGVHVSKNVPQVAAEDSLDSISDASQSNDASVRVVIMCRKETAKLDLSLDDQGFSSSDEGSIRERFVKFETTARLSEKTSTPNKQSESVDMQVEPGVAKVSSAEHISQVITLLKDARFFVMRSIGEANLALAKTHNAWVTTSKSKKKLEVAFKESTNVILVFTFRASKKFSGFARLSSMSSPEKVDWVIPKGLHLDLNTTLELDWISRNELDFLLTEHLYNPLNLDQLVKASRDGQEIKPQVGVKLCKLFERDSGVNLDSVVKKSLLSAERVASMMTQHVRPSMHPSDLRHRLPPRPEDLRIKILRKHSLSDSPSGRGSRGDSGYGNQPFPPQQYNTRGALNFSSRHGTPSDSVDQLHQNYGLSKPIPSLLSMRYDRPRLLPNQVAPLPQSRQEFEKDISFEERLVQYSETRTIHSYKASDFEQQCSRPRDSLKLVADHVAYEAYVQKHHKKKRKQSTGSNHRDLPPQAGPSRVCQEQCSPYDRHRGHGEVDRHSNYLEHKRNERSRHDIEKSSSKRQEHYKTSNDSRKRRNSSQSSHHRSKHSRLSESHETRHNKDDERRRYYLALAEKFGSAARQSSREHNTRRCQDNSMSEDRSDRHEKHVYRDVSSPTRESSTYREYNDRYHSRDRHCRPGDRRNSSTRRPTSPYCYSSRDRDYLSHPPSQYYWSTERFEQQGSSQPDHGNGDQHHNRQERTCSLAERWSHSSRSPRLDDRRLYSPVSTTASSYVDKERDRSTREAHSSGVPKFSTLKERRTSSSSCTSSSSVVSISSTSELPYDRQVNDFIKKTSGTNNHNSNDDSKKKSKSHVLLKPSRLETSANVSSTRSTRSRGDSSLLRWAAASEKSQQKPVPKAYATPNTNTIPVLITPYS